MLNGKYVFVYTNIYPKEVMMVVVLVADDVGQGWLWLEQYNVALLA